MELSFQVFLSSKRGLKLPLKTVAGFEPDTDDLADVFNQLPVLLLALLVQLFQIGTRDSVGVTHDHGLHLGRGHRGYLLPTWIVPGKMVRGYLSQP